MSGSAGWRLEAAGLLVVLAAGRWFGLAFVASGSMAPTLVPGDLIVYRRDVQAVAGDLAVFRRAGWRGGVVHRVVAVLPGRRLRTQGDANPVPDREPVERSRQRGRVVARLPSGRAVASARRLLRALALAAGR